MRNFFKKHHYLCFEHYNENHQLANKHWRIVSTWFWVRPMQVTDIALEHIIQEFNYDPKSVFLVSMSSV